MLCLEAAGLDSKGLGFRRYRGLGFRVQVLGGRLKVDNPA